MAFRLGRDGSLTVRGVASALEAIDQLNSQNSMAIDALQSEIANQTERLLMVKNDVAARADDLSEHKVLLSWATANISTQGSRLSGAVSTIAAADSIMSGLSSQLSSSLPSIAAEQSSLRLQGQLQTLNERTARNQQRSDLDEVELAAEYLAERTGQLNDSHSAIFSSVDALLEDQVCCKEGEKKVPPATVTPPLSANRGHSPATPVLLPLDP